MVRKIIKYLMASFIVLLLFTSLASAKWLPDTKLTDDPHSSQHPRIAAGNGYLHVVWTDARNRNTEIYYKRRKENIVKPEPLNWSEDIRLTYAPGTSYDPKIAVDKKGVHVVWFDNRNGNYEIYYKLCPAGLDSTKVENWSSDIKITHTPGNSKYPALALTLDELHVVWEESLGKSRKIFYKKCFAGFNSAEPSSWSEGVVLSGDSFSVYSPVITADERGLHVVWFDDREGSYRLHYKMSPSGSDYLVLSNWSKEIRLSDTESVAYNPALVASGKGLHMVWEDNREGKRKIFYKTCPIEADPTQARNWSRDLKLVDSPGTSYNPALTRRISGVHVVWEDNREGEYKIFYKVCPANRDGAVLANWSSDIKLTNVEATAERPDITASPSGIYVVWGDNREGNYEIYYKENDIQEEAFLNTRIGGFFLLDLLVIMAVLIF